MENEKYKCPLCKEESAELSCDDVKRVYRLKCKLCGYRYYFIENELATAEIWASIISKLDAQELNKISTWREANDILENTSSCNDCKIQKSCNIAPELGAKVRYNCFMWRC